MAVCQGDIVSPLLSGIWTPPPLPSCNARSCDGDEDKDENDRESRDKSKKHIRRMFVVVLSLFHFILKDLQVLFYVAKRNKRRKTA